MHNKAVGLNKKADPTPKISPNQKTSEPTLSVSLKYWHSKSQCISAWQKAELEKLAKTIEKIQTLTATKLRNDPGLNWKAHAGKVGAGFSRPSGLSTDVTLCEVRATSKARLHAAVLEGVFFLVWLDRNHEVFPDK